MYYLKMFLRLATIVYPIFIIASILYFLVGTDGWPYIFHAYDIGWFQKLAEGQKDNVFYYNMYLVGQMIICYWFSILFTKNMQYENPFVEFIGGTYAILFFIGWFFPPLTTYVLYPSILGFLYFGLMIFANCFWLFFFKKFLGFPGLSFTKGIFDGMNKYADKETTEVKSSTPLPIEKECQIFRARQIFENTVEIEWGYTENGKRTSGASSTTRNGKLQNWNSKSVTILENDGRMHEYDEHFRQVRVWKI